MKNFISCVAIVAMVVVLTTVEVEVRVNNPIGPPQTRRMPVVQFLVSAAKVAFTALMVAPLFAEPAPEEPDNRAFSMPEGIVARPVGADGFVELDNGDW
jgi:hypothetical protein